MIEINADLEGYLAPSVSYFEFEIYEHAHADCFVKFEKNFNLCEDYSRKLYDETGIETSPGTEYGNYPNHIVLNINKNKFDDDQVDALTKFNNRILDINYDRSRYKRTPFEDLENRLKL